MTATLTPSPSPSSVVAPVHTTSAGHLPKWAPWALLLVAFVLSATIFAFVNAGGDPADFNIALTLVVGLVFYMALIMVISSVVESRRHAIDRLMTALVSGAFVVALLPSSRCSTPSSSTASCASTESSSASRCATSWARAAARSTPSTARC